MYEVCRRDDIDIIAEVTYDASSGRWKINKVRDDKKAPNHITVVMDTLEAISEDVCFEELVYRLRLSPETDDWKRLTAYHLEKRNEDSRLSFKPSSSSSSSSNAHPPPHHHPQYQPPKKPSHPISNHHPSSLPPSLHNNNNNSDNNNGNINNGGDDDDDDDNNTNYNN